MSRHDRPSRTTAGPRTARTIAGLATTATVALVGLAGGAPAASAASPCADVDAAPSTVGVDRERTLAGLGPLAVDGTVRIAAQRYAEDMAARGFFAHESPEGTDPGQRLTIAGFAWSAYGENIAAGQQTVREVVAAWLDSKGHCENLMTPMFTVAGYGVAAADDGPYWTQEFARPMSSGATASALRAPACPRLPAADDAVPVPATTTAAPVAMAVPWSRRTARRLRVKLTLPPGDGPIAVRVRVRQGDRVVRTTTMRRPAGSVQRLTVRLPAARGGRVLVRAGGAPEVGATFR